MFSWHYNKKQNNTNFIFSNQSVAYYRVFSEGWIITKLPEETEINELEVKNKPSTAGFSHVTINFQRFFFKVQNKLGVI